MDDILIITAKHSERALSWASFLKTRFDKITKQRDRKPFNFLHIKIDDIPFSSELAAKCQTTALQIAILCPALLALPHKYLMSQFSTVINQEKILAILLDVAEEKVLEIHKTAFPSFRKWKRCIVRENDQSAIGNILGIATDILGRALCQRPPCQETTPNGTNSKFSFTYPNSTDEFTVVPRKVKIGQNKVLALLNDQLTKDDWIKITVEKSGEIFEIKSFKQRNPFTIQFNIPENCMEISSMVEIRIEKNDKNLGSRPIKCESRLRELEQLLRSQDSPIEFMCHSLGIGSTERDSLDLYLLQSFQKNMPPNFHLLTGPFEKQSQFLSIRDTSPEEYPTLLHFAAKWGLERLCMQLVECPGGEAACDLKNLNGKTPADIAEQENFQKLANSLKSFSQMHEFATMYHYFKGISDLPNTKVIIDTKTSGKSEKKSSKILLDTDNKQIENNAQTEAEYMEMSSGSENENQLKTNSTSNSSRPTTLAISNLNYINIETKDECCNLQSSPDELSNTLEQIKIEDSTVITNELKINEPPYYQSNEKNKTNSADGISRSGSIGDQFSQECSNLLDNSSISSNSDYLLQPSNIPVKQQNGDYMCQPSNKPVENILNNSNYLNDSIKSSFDESSHHLKLTYEKKKSSTLSINRNCGTLKRSGSDASSTKGNADDELAEIMYDFKNNVLSIREVEQLVEKWKNRNDVKQSFKEKQDQIEKLREEYEKIQDNMKEKLKRPTPFERVKRLFSRQKSSSSCNSKNSIENNGNSINDIDRKSLNRSYQSSQRPISSLSLQSVSSSSSSGRMSTGSACSGTSLGDSGTHSDHDERRHLFAINCRVGSPGSLIDNYLIPPVPRPISTPLSTSVEDKDRLVFMSNHHRITTPTSPDSEHYIMFPSNVPVFQDNQCGLNTIIETKETPNEFSCNNNNNNSNDKIIVTPIKIHNSNERNIIYGKLHKNHPKEFCSSFKPNVVQLQNQSTATLFDMKKEMSDVYQNINGIDEQKVTGIQNKTILPMQDINISRQSSCDNNNISFDSQDEHNYINI